jgi:hypothetical protein
VFEVGGRAISVLTVEQQLVVACLDLAEAPVAPLVQLRDVVQLALSPALDGRQTRRLAQRLGAAAALAHVVALAWETFDLADRTELSVWALRLASTASGGAPTPAGRRRAPAALARRLLGRKQPAPTVTPLRAAASVAPAGSAGSAAAAGGSVARAPTPSPTAPSAHRPATRSR